MDPARYRVQHMAPDTELMDATTYIEHPPRERWTQLIGGRIIVSAPKVWHQRVVGDLFFELESWVRSDSGCGEASLPINIRVTDFDVFVPDLVWYANPEVLEPHAPAQLVLPDLVIEARSPSTWVYDVGVKRTRYEEHGVRELWLVDHEAIMVFRRSEPETPQFDIELELGLDDTLTSPMLPGFELPVTDLLRTDP
jgi:Uma2 family endonuclease